VKAFSLLIVSWNSSDTLPACVESLARVRAALGRERDRLELIVVDNHSEIFPEERIRAAWPDARLAVLDQNIGLGPAANHAASHARGEILFFLNPDTRAEGEPFSRISEAFEENPDVAAVAPRLLQDAESPVAETQEEFQLRRLPRLSTAIRELLLFDRAFPGNPGRAADRYLARDRERSFDVEQPAGAALAVRRDIFSAVGGFDPRFVPAWWEDVDLCRRLVEKGRILYLPEARFRHRGGEAAARLGYGGFLPLYYRNALLYWRKHFPPASVAAFRLLLALGMGLRLLLLPFRAGAPRPGRESFSAYRGALAVAFRGR
jgi:GT2 family glycosyltransferase